MIPMAEETERIYVIPLKKKGIVHSKAAPSAMKRVKQYLQKHMKAAESDIWIDDSLNHAIWKHGRYDVPTKIRVKAVRFEDGVVEAYLPDLEFTKSRREILQEERAKKTPILRKEEPGEEEEAETGAEDYDVVPGPDGEVKIKKKKAKKEDDEEEEAEESDTEEDTSTDTNVEEEEVSSEREPSEETPDEAEEAEEESEAQDAEDKKKESSNK
jgi:large subunit ribosomal protein L31e